MDAIMQKPWTPEEIEVVKDMAAKGMSAAGIAAEVGRTRNSVIGAIHRNKVQLLTKKIPKPKKERAPRPSRGNHLRRIFLTTSEPKELKYDTPPPPPPNKEHYVPFLDRKYFQCKFIVEKRGDTHICCGTTATRRGWCEYHASIVFRPFDPKPIKREGGDGSNPALRGSSK